MGTTTHSYSGGEILKRTAMTEETIGDINVDELLLLKNRAQAMGINFHPNIGVDKLKAKIEETLNSDSSQAAPTQVVTAAKEALPETKNQRRNRLRKKASKLVRVRITCMNPVKSDWEGEIFTVSNSVVGTFKKFVPFDTDDGWHVPQMILNMIQERKCQVFTTVKDNRGRKVKKGKTIKEFGVEILPSLTKTELTNLARSQAMRKGED